MVWLFHNLLASSSASPALKLCSTSWQQQMVPGGLSTMPFRVLVAAAPEAQEHRRKTTFFSGTKSRACLRLMSALRQELYKVPALFRCSLWLFLEPEPLCWVLGRALASCSPRTLQEGLLWLLQPPVHEHFQPGLQTGSAVLPGEEHPSTAAALAKALGMEAGTVHEYEFSVVLQCPFYIAKCNIKTSSVQPGHWFIAGQGVALMGSQQLWDDGCRGIKTSLIQLNNAPNDKPLKSSWLPDSSNCIRQGDYTTHQHW